MKAFYVMLIIGTILVASLFAATGSLEVTVVDEQNKPLSGAAVFLIHNSVLVAESKTNDKGVAELINIPEGTYNVVCRQPSYRDETRSVVKINPAQVTKLEIKMAIATPERTTPVPESIAHRSIAMEAMQTLDVSEIKGIISIPQGTRPSEQVRGGRADETAKTPAPSVSMPGLQPSDSYIEHETDEFSTIRPNVFLLSHVNPLSTFSIDVDTGSYSILRAWLNSNRLPPTNSIRTEELLNYFTYEYPQPQGKHPFEIYTELGTSPWNEKRQLVHIGLQGKQLQMEEAPPNNLVFLVDVSGSMNHPNRLPLVISSLNMLVDGLREQDRIAIVVYASQTGVALPSTPGNKKAEIKAVLNSLRAQGSTAGYSAIQEAYRVAEENFIKEGNNRIILCTDGDFNVGVSSTAHLVELVKEKSETGIYITVLGFGMGNYKDDRLKQLSMHGNGTYGYIDTILEAKKIFVHELTSTLFAIAHDVKIQVEFNPAFVEAYRLIGYEKRILRTEDFRDDTVDAGELGAGHTVTALYEIIPKGSGEKIPIVDELKYQSVKVSSKAKSSNELLTVKLRYKLPGEDTSIPLEKTVLNKPTQWKRCSADFRFSAAVAGFSMLLQDSEFIGHFSWNMLKEMTKESLGEDLYGYRADFQKMIQMAELLKNR